MLQIDLLRMGRCEINEQVVPRPTVCKYYERKEEQEQTITSKSKQE